MLFQNNPTFTDTDLYASAEEIRQLPQFFRATPEYVYRLGGPAYRRILDRAPLEGKHKYISIDSRVHMLNPGQLACIGGWHCDDFHRPGTEGQPDLFDVAATPWLQHRHHALILGMASASTVFAAQPFELPDSALRAPAVYKACHKKIEAIGPVLHYLTPGEFASFGALDFHKGQPAKGPGWRLFVRITETNTYEPKNELRTQTQVYIIDESAGW